MSLPQPPRLTPFHFQEEDELTQECRDLISSLPKAPCRIDRYLYQYQGCWMIPGLLKGVLEFQKHFEAQDTDILLASHPKSGTTWLKAILFSLVNRGRYPECRQNPLLINNPHALVPFLEIHLYAGNQVPDLTAFAPPRLFATHLPYTLLPTSVKDFASKIVYLCRNPKDTFVSLWHFLPKFKPTSRDNLSVEEFFDQFCNGVTTFGPYWDNLLGYWKESSEKPEKILFLTYEEVKVQPAATLRRLAEFLGCPFSPEEEAQGIGHDIVKLCSFDNLRNLEVNKVGRTPEGVENSSFFRRGKIGDWMNCLTAEMAEKLDHITEEKCKGTGLQF